MVRPAFRWLVVPAILTGWVGAWAEAGSSQVLTGAQLPVVEHELANGMRWLVLPRTGAPTVSFTVKFRVGAVNEVRGQTGMAHLLEHLLFKGTETLGTRDATAERALFVRMDALQDSILALEAQGDITAVPVLRERIDSLETEAGAYVLPNEFERVLSTNGGRSLNATTDWESTTYYMELPANRAQFWFLLESDRMANPVFREFYAERNIVAEERRLRVETNPGGLLFEAHMAAAFTTHPYGQPVVGYMADIQRLRRPDVEAYFRRYYGPSNAVVTVVGLGIENDFDPSFSPLGGLPRQDRPRSLAGGKISKVFIGPGKNLIGVDVPAGANRVAGRRNFAPRRTSPFGPLLATHRRTHVEATSAPRDRGSSRDGDLLVNGARHPVSRNLYDRCHTAFPQQYRRCRGRRVRRARLSSANASVRTRDAANSKSARGG